MPFHFRRFRPPFDPYSSSRTMGPRSPPSCHGNPIGDSLYAGAENGDQQEFELVDVGRFYYHFRLSSEKTRKPEIELIRLMCSAGSRSKATPDRPGCSSRVT